MRAKARETRASPGSYNRRTTPESRRRSEPGRYATVATTVNSDLRTRINEGQAAGPALTAKSLGGRRERQRLRKYVDFGRESMAKAGDAAGEFKIQIVSDVTAGGFGHLRDISIRAG